LPLQTYLLYFRCYTVVDERPLAQKLQDALTFKVLTRTITGIGTACVKHRTKDLML